MGRRSSTGLPYLVLRLDAGQYTYTRSVSLEVAPLVVGTIELGWCGRTRTLAGRTTIKLSLGTGDTRTARTRWAEIHPQVDALVQLAQLQVRHAVDGPGEGAGNADAVEGLSDSHVRILAAQAGHDVLAGHDRTQVDRTFTAPITELLLRLSRRSPAHSEADARVIARRLADKLERQRLGRRLARETTHALDFTVVEEEVDASILDLSDTSFAVGQRLAPEQVEALANGIRIGDIASEVETLLRDNGLDLPKHHPDRRAIALAVTRSKMKALGLVRDRDRGAPIETPERPPAVCLPDAPCETEPTLSVMRARWIELKRPSRKQVDDNGRYVRLFIGLHGDLPVDRIKGKHVRGFRDRLLLCPRNPPKTLAVASIEELSAWATINPDEPTLGRGTINNKALGSISALMKVALKEEHITANPVDGQKLEIKSEDELERQPLTIDELNAVLNTSVYAMTPFIPKAGGGWAAWWLPLLGLFSGARLEELGQLLLSDIKIETDIRYLDITDLPDETGQSTDKSMKSDAGRRRVPLHRVLIELGFLDYVNFLKGRGFTRLFPELQDYRDRYTKNWSRWWGRWMDRHVSADESKAYHSLRHNFVAALRKTKVNEPIIKSLVGHAMNDVTSGYGRVFGQVYDLSTLDAEIQRIRFDGLDLHHLVGRTPWRE